MTRTDSLVVGTLVALLALIASLVSVPSLLPTAASSLEPGATAAPIARPYREGVLGRPDSVSPLSARTQADRDLVALVYAGLVRNGPSGSLVPDLAERWSVDSSGAVWTFQLRDDARCRLLLSAKRCRDQVHRQVGMSARIPISLRRG